jgi:hypothetical protein
LMLLSRRDSSGSSVMCHERMHMLRGRAVRLCQTTST